MIARLFALSLALGPLAAPGRAAPGFTVSEIAIRQPGAHVFMAQLAEGGPPCLAVLDGSFLSFYSGIGAEPSFGLNLPPGASAVDVADIDADGRAEILAIEHGRVLRFDVVTAGAGAPADPRVLFEAASMISGPSPYPSVMAIPWEGKAAIAIPLEGGMQIRSPAGEILADFPAESQAPPQFLFAAPFAARTVASAQAGSPGSSIEWVINASPDATPELPELLGPATPAPPLSGRTGSPGLLREAGSRPPESWPWFSLRTGTGGGPFERVHFALAPPDYRGTSISIRRLGTGGPPTPDRAFSLSPARLYPGVLVAPRETLPDFNRDGYSDLLLWNTPTPGASIEGITRAVQEGSWPVLLSVHLFDPAQGIYAARPISLVRTGVPLSWFVELENGAPMRNLTLADFDGDGGCDLGLSNSPGSFSIWLYREGFSNEPSFRRPFRQTIRATEVLASASRPAVVLRGATALFVLVANGD